MADTPTYRIVITGGGTGGHLFPGIALGQALLRTYPGSSVLFVSTARSIDRTTMDRLGLDIATIRCRGLKGAGFLAGIRTLIGLPPSIVAAARVLLRFKPDLVFGVGGYVTGPVVLAARLLGIPACIHEQNSIPGLANRMLGRIVKKIFISLPGSERFFPAARTVLTGNPVRREILAAAEKSATGPVTDEQTNNTLLVLGGSKGAHRVNTLVLEALAGLIDELPGNFNLIHQTGADDYEMVVKGYGQLGIKARVAPFFQDMAGIYSLADVVISRAGATTLAELMVMRKPTILIPYPFAADNHQEENGRLVVENKGARMFREQELSGAILGHELLTLIRDSGLRSQLAANIGQLAQTRATEKILDACLALV
ncbi:MAG: undecaprenyldiphospho-muramoylpentapeptide beta-N-acetylglucosaminyltransferase [Desulfobacterales bacterium]|nr:undecaprenyldiphospho-muramoylpentapeptide beta-N-acetylglucosaminyltransferase [Desulfobacterales bacterium]